MSSLITMVGFCPQSLLLSSTRPNQHNPWYCRYNAHQYIHALHFDRASLASLQWRLVPHNWDCILIWPAARRSNQTDVTATTDARRRRQAAPLEILLPVRLQDNKYCQLCCWVTTTCNYNRNTDITLTIIADHVLSFRLIKTAVRLVRCW